MNLNLEDNNLYFNLVKSFSSFDKIKNIFLMFFSFIFAQKTKT